MPALSAIPIHALLWCFPHSSMFYCATALYACSVHGGRDLTAALRQAGGTPPRVQQPPLEQQAKPLTLALPVLAPESVRSPIGNNDTASGSDMPSSNEPAFFDFGQLQLPACNLLLTGLASLDGAPSASSVSLPAPVPARPGTGACMVPWPDDFFLSSTYLQPPFLHPGSTTSGNSSTSGSSTTQPQPQQPPFLLIQDSTFPFDILGRSINVTAGGYTAKQGFDPMGPIITVIPGLDLNASHVPRAWDIGVSMELDTSPTLLLEEDTMTPIPHWCELDTSADVTASMAAGAKSGARGQPVNPAAAAAFAAGAAARADPARAFMIWPAFQLQPGKRYIVATRNLKNSTGGLVRQPPLIPLLLSSNNNSNTQPSWMNVTSAVWSANVARYATISMRLRSFGHGWDAANADNTVNQCWDFTVNTDRNLTSEMVFMRDDSRAKLLVIESEAASSNNASYLSQFPNNRTGTSGATWSIATIIDNPPQYPNVGRLVLGTFSVPLYLNTPEPGPGVFLLRNASTGFPYSVNFTHVRFTAVVPNSIMNTSSASNFAVSNSSLAINGVRLVPYGHGLFGNQSSVLDPVILQQANEQGWVCVSTDWWGLSDADVPTVAYVFSTDLTLFKTITDRTHQGILNQLLLTRLFTRADAGSIINHPAFLLPAPVSSSPSAAASSPAAAAAMPMSMLITRSQTTSASGQPVITTAHVPAVYYGISLGGILGSVYMALQQVCGTLDVDE